eukprot:1841601-Prymnesium_polylepis.1
MAEKAPPAVRCPAWDPVQPGKPWTSALLSLDDATARQSRIAKDHLRFRDGKLRISPVRSMRAPFNKEPNFGGV